MVVRVVALGIEWRIAGREARKPEFCLASVTAHSHFSSSRKARDAGSIVQVHWPSVLLKTRTKKMSPDVCLSVPSPVWRLLPGKEPC